MQEMYHINYKYRLRHIYIYYKKTIVYNISIILRRSRAELQTVHTDFFMYFAMNNWKNRIFKANFPRSAITPSTSTRMRCRPHAVVLISMQRLSRSTHTSRISLIPFHFHLNETVKILMRDVHLFICLVAVKGLLVFRALYSCNNASKR